jgi:putative transposase
VLPERITPGKPQENGRLERLHLTLLQDTASPPAATLRAQAARFRDFRATYNQDRPHAALGNATPAECYAPSPRRWDGVLRSPEPAVDAVRRVKSNGLIRWHGVLVYISEALAGEPIGLDEGDDGLWTVRYGPILLGLLADRGDTLIRLPQKGCGLVDNAARCPQGPQPPQPQPPRT